MIIYFNLCRNQIKYKNTKCYLVVNAENLTYTNSSYVLNRSLKNGNGMEINSYLF